MISLKQYYRIDTMHDLSTQFSCEWSENDILAIQYGDRVHIMQLMSSPCNLDDKLNFSHDLIQPPLHFTVEVDKNRSNLKGSDDIKDALALPHLTYGSNDKNIISKVIQIKWSPLQFLYNNTPILAVLSSAGVVMIYVKDSLDWNLILNLTDKIRKAVFKSFESLDANMLWTTCISWMGYFKHGNSHFSHFATAQRDGIIYIWNISIEKQIKIDIFNVAFSCDILSNIKHVISMKWVPVTDIKGFLILGGINGDVQIYSLEINSEGKFSIKENKFIYEEKDRLAVVHIEYCQIDSNSIAVVLIKSQNVVVILVNIHTLQVEEMQFENLNSVITGCVWYASSQLALSTYNNGLNVVSIYFNDKSNRYLKASPVTFCHENIAITGLALSLNKAIWVYTAIPSTNLYRKVSFRYSICFSWSDEFAPIKDALLSETFTVRDNNDYLEIFRYLVIKKKLSLIMWLTKLRPLRDLHLKLYLYLLQLHFAVKQSNRTELQYDYRAEEAKTSKMKEDKADIHNCLLSLMSKSAVERLLSYTIKTEEPITDFRRTSLQTCLSLVKHVEMSHGRDWKTSFHSQSLKLLKDIEDMPPTPCEWCQDDVYGVTCVSGHPVQRCCLTFQEIQNGEYIVCSCGLIAISELIMENPLCPFCDNKFKRNYLCSTSEDR